MKAEKYLRMALASRPAAARSEQVLGISFFDGTAEEAVREALSGGLVVAPSGTCFERFLEDDEYRRAILTADIVLPDSGLMVSLWRILRGRSLQRISGLAYLRQLQSYPDFQEAKRLWVLPNERSREKLLAWSESNRHSILPNDCYIAPIYNNAVEDKTLLDLVESEQSRHLIIAIGAGAQEKLGWFLREHASGRPAIHCIGGALGFITGDQVAIPDWADRFYLGWLLRLLAQPRVFVPRLWKARLLPWLIMNYGEKLPPLRNHEQ